MLPHSLLLLPLILHLSSFQGAAGFQDAAASGPLVPPADCHNASRCAAAASCPLNDPLPPVCKRLPSCWPLVRQLVVVSPLLSRRRRLLSFQYAASASRYSHWLVVASHLVALLPPTIFSSTPPPLDALATHLPSRLPLVPPNRLPVCLTWYAL